MAPNQDENGGRAHIGAQVPTNHAEALFQLAQHRSTRADRTTQSDLIREAISEYLPKQDDLPEETRDLLDDDLLANAGGDEFGGDGS